MIARRCIIAVAAAAVATAASCTTSQPSTQPTTEPQATSAITGAPDASGPDASGPDATAPNATGPEATASDSTGPATTSTSSTTPRESYGTSWERVTAPADCECSDGSDYSFFVRRADPTKVLFYLEGGGACFDLASCRPAAGNFKPTVGYADGLTVDTGIFDLTNPANPFADYSMVFVPYCSADGHLGNTITDYGDGVQVRHKGLVNGSAALAAAANLFPAATEFVVAGVSMGAVGAPLYAGLAHDLWPAARITVVADGAGGYPDDPAFNRLLVSSWGIAEALPTWIPANALTLDQWSLPDLYVYTAAHAPGVVFARHDFAEDAIHRYVNDLGGIAEEDLLLLIDQNTASLQRSGVDVASFVSPGAAHTILASAEFYDHEVEGVRLVDWVGAVAAGEQVSDVHCDVCRP